jgi:hypothetical protein
VHSQHPQTGHAEPVLFGAAIATVNRVVQVAGTPLASIVEQAQPTANLLRALSEELQRAVTKPKSVAHPELVDPDVYWQRSLWPQASAVVKAARSLLVEVAAELQPTIPAAEQEMQAWLNWRAYETQQHRAADPEHVRDLIVDEIATCCEELHHIMEMVSVLRPPLDAIESLQGELDDRRRKDAIVDVKKAKADYERQNGHLDSRLVKQHWEDTFEQRVAIRETELRAVLPWRHQDLAIDAHRQLRTTLARDIDDMIEDLTKPILEIGERLVQMYDQLVAVPIGAMAPGDYVAPPPPA